MDSWSEINLKKMEVGGNDRLNAFFANHGVPKETYIPAKYNSPVAAVYRDRVQALAEGRHWTDPPIIPSGAGGSRKPPLRQSPVKENDWDSWGNSADELRSPGDMRRHQSVSDLRVLSEGRAGGSQLSRSRSTEDVFTRSQLVTSAANKESFFSRKMEENASRSDGIPPSQGGKYVGFGSSRSPVSMHRNSSQGDMFSVVSQGIGRLSMVAASAAESAAIVIQAGATELASKVREVGYDQTVSAVTTKTSEIGQRTWGIMKDVMAMATQKVEEYANEGTMWKGDDLQLSENERNGYYHEFSPENRKWNSPAEQFSGTKHHSSSSWDWNSPAEQFSGTKHHSSSSWDDWDDKGDKDSSKRTQREDSWGGWDDLKDDSHHHGPSSKGSSVHPAKSGSNCTGGGFV